MAHLEKVLSNEPAAEAKATPELPAKYKAIVYDNPGTVSTKIVELDMPEPGVGEVLINITHSGVCHSDFSIMTNSWKNFPFPTAAGQVGGHEGVGKIVKFGPGAEASGLKMGQRVGIKWVSSVCGSCLPCLATSDGLCFNQKISGYYTPGTFQQYTIGPANYVTPIPDELPSEMAAPLLCAGVTVYSALRKANARPGDWVVISGSGGGLGHLACQYASKGFGFRVIGIDSASKKDITLESGAEHFVNIEEFFPPKSKEAPAEGAEEKKFDAAAANQAMVDHVKALAGGLGATASIICTASNAAFAQGFEVLRFNGTLVAVGLPEGAPIPINTVSPMSLVTRQTHVVGSAVGNRQEAIETMDFAARGLVKVHAKIVGMDKLTETFEAMDRGEMVGRTVLDLSG